MNEKALRILEYPKIIDMLTGYASSPMGKDLCRNLMPSSDISEILQGQMETDPCHEKGQPLLLRHPRYPRLSASAEGWQYRRYG